LLIIIFVATCVLVGIDQIIKVWAIESLVGQGSRQFIKIGSKEIINLRYLENDGALFGSFSGMRWLLIISVVILVSACIIYLIRNYKQMSKLLTFSLTLVISGGVGNLIDRIFRNGVVIDYIEIRLFDFAIFNFADCCVTIGVALLVIYIIFIDGSNVNEPVLNVDKVEENE
jgi:signal peptidase II